jgi:hypothetical protein
MLAWYVDGRNYVEIALLGEKDKVVLKHRAEGTVILKSKYAVSLDPGATYRTKVTFDGTGFSVYLDGNILFTTPALTTPFGKLGFRVKGARSADSAVAIDNVVVR